MCSPPSVVSGLLCGPVTTYLTPLWGSPGKSVERVSTPFSVAMLEPPPYPGRARVGVVRWLAGCRLVPFPESVRVKGGRCPGRHVSWLSQGSCLCHRRRRCPPGLGDASWLRKPQTNSAFQTMDTTLSSKVDWKGFIRES